MSLEAFDGQVYAGYGDYAANTGPIAVYSFDTAARAFQLQHRQDSEAVYNFRRINGRIFAPSIDPRIGADFAAGGPWADHDDTAAAHVFDMATLTGDDLWMVGSVDQNAVAWRSLDGGLTWDEHLVVPPASGRADDFARFYFAGVLDGRLYVQAFDWAGGAHAASNVFDGTQWVTGPALVEGRNPGWRPVAFNGQLVLAGGGQGLYGPVYLFDGMTSTALIGGFDVEVVGRELYVITHDGSIVKSRNGRRWTGIGSVPGGLSLAGDGSGLYVGTRSSEIWSVNL